MHVVFICKHSLISNRIDASLPALQEGWWIRELGNMSDALKLLQSAAIHGAVTPPPSTSVFTLDSVMDVKGTSSKS